MGPRHFIALTLLAGCTAGQGFETGNFSVYGDIPYPQQDIELAIAAVNQQTGGGLESDRYNFEVVFCSDCLTANANGVAWDLSVWVRPMGDCVMQSALTHELIHLYQHRQGVSDPGHSADNTWGQGVDGSLENVLAKSISPLTCSDSQAAIDALIIR